ncbi:hypothetical protein Q3G72_029798 [Acer saccharum]|nr:hypothetical protein Q3G72_029798 [Acer saccharum]
MLDASSLNPDIIGLPAPPPQPPPPPPQIPLSWPSDGQPSLEWVHNLMYTFDWSSRNLPPTDLPFVLPVNVFDSLVLTASKILHKEPNCVRIEEGIDQDSTVVVVVDVHWQLHDVLFLLKDAGFPSENRFFVFNCDYVDRGAWGLETFLVLLAWKVTFSILIQFYSFAFFFEIL